jgi:hypothetical protein
VISQSNGTSKYICKYVTKIDEGNKAILFSNSRTEDIRVGSKFLHNTKIATSAINESKAFQSKRYKNHPTGTEFPDIYSLHLILDYPEVTTNIPFIPNNTGPFELRTQHTVRLSQCGNVIHNNEANDVVGELFLSSVAAFVWISCSATMAGFGGIFCFIFFSVSGYCGSIWREVCFRFLFSQLFLAASGGNLFWFLFSQHLLMPHLGARFVFGSF